MKSKSALRSLVHASGVTAGVRYWSRNSIRILMYHRFPANNELEPQCEHLAKHYRPVSLTEAAESLKKRRPIPNAVVVTIDDGYRDFLLNAWPVFKAYSIPAMVYVATDLPDYNSWLWTDQLSYTLRKNGNPDASAIKQRLKKAPDQERRAFLQSVEGLQSTPPTGYEPLTWDDIRTLAKEGVDFGAHTRSHPILSRLPNRDRMRDEIAGSKTRLEQELGSVVIHFCYPNGTPADYNDEVVSVVRECGYRTAVTAMPGVNGAGADPFLLKRLHQEPTREPSAFAHQVAGLYRS